MPSGALGPRTSVHWLFAGTPGLSGSEAHNTILPDSLLVPKEHSAHPREASGRELEPCGVGPDGSQLLDSVKAAVDSVESRCGHKPVRVAVPVKPHSQTLKVQFHILFPCHRVCSFLSLSEPFKNNVAVLSLRAPWDQAAGGCEPGENFPSCSHALTCGLVLSPLAVDGVSGAGTEPSFGEPSCWHSHTLQGQMSSDPFLENTVLPGGP